MTIINNDGTTLQHFGVRGMRWGVRKRSGGKQRESTFGTKGNRSKNQKKRKAVFGAGATIAGLLVSRSIGSSMLSSTGFNPIVEAGRVSASIGLVAIGATALSDLD